MSKQQWFRLYAEFAFDPKIQALSETFQRRYIMLLCLKCNDDLDNLQPDEVAFALRISEDELAETCEKLRAKGLLGEAFEIPAWDKRQYKSDTSTSRVREYRQRKKKETLHETGAETPCNVSETPPETETETESETETVVVIDNSRVTPANLSEWMGDTVASPATSPGICVLAQPLQWQNLYDWDGVVIPTLTAWKARYRGPPIRSWAYFNQMLADANAKATAPQPEGTYHENVHPLPTSKREQRRAALRRSQERYAKQG